MVGGRFMAASKVLGEETVAGAGAGAGLGTAGTDVAVDRTAE